MYTTAILPNLLPVVWQKKNCVKFYRTRQQYLRTSNRPHFHLSWTVKNNLRSFTNPKCIVRILYGNRASWRRHKSQKNKTIIITILRLFCVHVICKRADVTAARELHAAIILYLYARSRRSHAFASRVKINLRLFSAILCAHNKNTRDCTIILLTYTYSKKYLYAQVFLYLTTNKLYIYIERERHRFNILWFVYALLHRKRAGNKYQDFSSPSRVPFFLRIISNS